MLYSSFLGQLTGRGEGGGTQKKRLERRGSGLLTLPSGNLTKSPDPERQVGRGCFGQCSGREGTGLYCAASSTSTFWRALEQARHEGGGRELFRVGLLLP